MAKALITTLINEKYCSPSQIIATHHNVASINSLEKEIRVMVSSSNSKAIILSEIIILCVRPQQFPELINEIKPFIKDHHIIISIAVGVPIEWLRMEFPNCNSIFHIHPPSTIFASSKGISFIASEQKNLTDSNLIVKDIFESFGEVIFVPEVDIDNYAVFVGCSPAFISRMAANWINLAIENGIPKEVADKIIVATFQSVTNSLVNLNISLKDFENKITTPNGVTEMGLRVIEKYDLGNIFVEIINKSKDKIKKIKNIFNAIEQI